MNYKLEKEILSFLVTDVEIWEYLGEKKFDPRLCTLALNYLRGEIYLLKILEGTRYSVDFAETILPRLYSESVLNQFREMIYNHSQRLFWIANKRLNMKKEGICLKSIGTFDTISLVVCV